MSAWFGARAAAEEPLVLRRDEDVRAVDRRTRDDDAVIVLGGDPPTREMRRRSRRLERGIHRPHAPGIGERGDAAAGVSARNATVEAEPWDTHGYRRGWCISKAAALTRRDAADGSGAAACG